MENTAQDMTIKDEVELLKRFKETREFKEKMAAEAADASKAHEKVKQELIKFLTDAGKPNVAYEGLGRASLVTGFTATVPEEHKDEFYTWLKEKGYAPIVKETVHHATLSSTVKQMVVDGVEVPEYVKQGEYSNISYSAGG